MLLAPGLAAQSVRLNGALPAGGDVGVGGVNRPFFQISHDGKRAVYVADEDTNGVMELYVVPVDGSAPPVKLNQSLVAGGSVGRSWTGSYPFRYFEITPDDARVVYTADADTNDVQELYSVPLDGSAPPIRLNQPLVAGGSVFGFYDPPFLVAADSMHVVFRADADVDGLNELYVVPVDASAPPRKLNTALSSGGGVVAFTLTPAGDTAVFSARAGSSAPLQLFAVPLAGGAPVPIGGSLGLVSPTVSAPTFRLSPDGTAVVFMAGTLAWELFSAPVDGSTAPVRLHPAQAPGRNVSLAPGGLSFASPFVIGPDGRRVLYVADHDVDDVYEVYSAPLDGSEPPVKLDLPGLQAPLSGVPDPPRFSPDGTRAVFLVASDNSSPLRELQSAPADGSEPAFVLNGPLVASGTIHGDFLISADSDLVVYRAQQDDLIDSLYRVPIRGGSAARLTPAGVPVVDNLSLPTTRFDPTGKRVYFVGGKRLRQVDVHGASRPLPVSGAGVQADWDFVPGGRRILFRSDEETAGVYELLSRRLTQGVRSLE